MTLYNSTSLCSPTSTNTFCMADCGENSIVSGTESSFTCSAAFIVDNVTTGDTICEVPASNAINGNVMEANNDDVTDNSVVLANNGDVTEAIGVVLANATDIKCSARWY